MEKYSEMKKIGEGGQAIVYEIEDDSGNKYARKVLLNADEEYRLRFEREIRILSKIKHKNIVPIISYDIESEKYSFIMPLAEGNLGEYIREYKRGKSEMGFFIDILEGVKKAHEEGIIHRDLNPNNVLIFLDENNNYFAAISDFGLGVFCERDTKSITSTNVGMGTENYYSPEQKKNAKDVDHRTDIFSLGVILSYILTGGPCTLVGHDDIPREYLHIIKRSCQLDPGKRYQSISDLYEAVDNIRFGSYDKPEVLLKKEIEMLKEKPDSIIERIKNILNIFISNSPDYSLYTRCLPRINNKILMMMVKGYSSEFETIFIQYDEHTEESTSFEYCDVIANFYQNVFNWTDSNDIKLIIVRRLPIMGYHANRWSVGRVFAKILSEIDDPGLIEEIYSIFKNQSYVAAFCLSYCDGISLPSRLNEFR
ncbi:serine/threonine-protein kinase [Methanolacinia paynteri]|uniref:serine/threonine-protein kinase n=1 Tax=Methanolacinia paynteri TaxID=230356 RepID=UPI00064F0D01|nr:serine/threonine-protein kinase [Methanolacinia paynteri]